ELARPFAVIEHAAHQLDALRVALLLNEEAIDRRKQLFALGLEGARAPVPDERLVDLAEAAEDLPGPLRELGRRVVVAVDLFELGRVDLAELALGRRGPREALE